MMSLHKTSSLLRAIVSLSFPALSVNVGVSVARGNPRIILPLGFPLLSAVVSTLTHHGRFWLLQAAVLLVALQIRPVWKGTVSEALIILLLAIELLARRIQKETVWG